MTTTTDKGLTDEELMAIVDVATPGKWEWWNGNSWWRLGSTDASFRGLNPTIVEPTKHWKDGHPDLIVRDEDKAFIATFDPPMVRALIERARGAEKERDELKGSSAEHDLFDAENDAAFKDLDARIEELEASLKAAEERARAAERERDHLKEREAHFAKALSVADGGQYRNDWDAAISTILARALAMEEALKVVLKTRNRVGLPAGFSQSLFDDIQELVTGKRPPLASRSTEAQS